MLGGAGLAWLALRPWRLAQSPRLGALLIAPDGQTVLLTQGNVGGRRPGARGPGPLAFGLAELDVDVLTVEGAFNKGMDLEHFGKLIGKDESDDKVRLSLLR